MDKKEWNEWKDAYVKCAEALGYKHDDSEYKYYRVRHSPDCMFELELHDLNLSATESPDFLWADWNSDYIYKTLSKYLVDEHDAACGIYKLTDGHVSICISKFYWSNDVLQSGVSVRRRYWQREFPYESDRHSHREFFKLFADFMSLQNAKT